MFKPRFTISPQIASQLMQIEAIRQEIYDLPIAVSVLNSLRETARLQATYYSTKIEGNRLTQEEVNDVIIKSEHFSGRERDEKEVLGYYTALAEVERHAQQKKAVTENTIQNIHALVMGGGKKRVRAYNLSRVLQEIIG